MKSFLKNNAIILVWLPLAFIMEMYGVIFTDTYPILSAPYFLILLLLSIWVIMYITNSKRAQYIISIILLVLQVLIITAFIYLYDSNGTYFDWGFVSQRNDGFGTIESFKLRLGFLIPALAALTAFITTFAFYIKRHKAKSTIKNNLRGPVKKVVSLLLFVFTIGAIGHPVLVGFNTNNNYIDILYGKGNNPYQKQGITATLVFEAIKGPTTNIISANSYSQENIDEFIYSDLAETSKYHGISEGNNLVLILVESFEWFPLEIYDDEITKIIYPNLYKFREQSLVASNFYAREKTDVSEALSLLSNYPTGEFINYAFDKNSYPFSLPNMFKAHHNNNDNNTTVSAFHNNKTTFYNRDTLNKSLGFDKFYGIEFMEKQGVKNTWNSLQHERNLDSDTMDKMKSFMFPTNETFFSFNVTFTMHGFYNERETFKKQGYYDFFDEHNVFPKTSVQHANYLRTYAAAVKDFDISIGYMMDYLGGNNNDNKNLLEDTTIVMFSDHNTYYNNLSYYAKGIEEKHNSELYRIPLMIYDEKLTAAMEENNEGNEITKFTTTSDIPLTIYDLLGIKAWKNLYFGTSIFVEDVESIIYSRAYEIFVTDKLIGYSLTNLKYAHPNLTQNDLNIFEQRAKIHLEKLEFVNRMYYTNYFDNNPYLPPLPENIISQTQYC